MTSPPRRKLIFKQYMRRSTIATLLLLTAFANCLAQDFSRHSITTGRTYPPTRAADIEVLFELPQRSYEIIGLIDVSKDIAVSRKRAKRKALDKALKRAAKLGASAIVIEGYNKQFGLIDDKMNINVKAIRHINENPEAEAASIPETASIPAGANTAVTATIINGYNGGTTIMSDTYIIGVGNKAKRPTHI